MICNVRFLFPVVACLLAVPSVAAQGFQVIYPNLSGSELIDSVSRNFRPETVLDYANSRDTLYARVLAIDDDSLRCIYSGHALWLDPTQDPTQYVYQNGGPNGMNTEHAYPQAKGAATGNARSDMHHLYPTRIPVNEARGNLPYAEIPDNQTQKWFFRNQTLTVMPTSNKDAYSEWKPDAFEPRESVKGDLARSVFYFYTMYRAQANAADPDFFAVQRLTLCQWAAQDPPDSTELRKTWRIAPYQNGKPNPFVVDCTLASRCWCPEVQPVCLTKAIEPVNSREKALEAWPNPAAATLHARLPMSGPAVFVLQNIAGGRQIRVESSNGEASFDVQGLPPGSYLLSAYDAGRVEWRAVVIGR
jgi:endonuclease I